MSEQNPEKAVEQLSYSQKIDMFKDLLQAFKNRDDFAGDFDTFAESAAHAGNNMSEYNRLSGICDNIRIAVDEAIVDKEAFATQLEDDGEANLAHVFREVFGLRNATGLLGRFRQAFFSQD